MDVTSYLLGKQAGGGGGQPTLQEKEIEITENGTTSVVADTGYDGLSEVEITTNVSGGTVNKIYPTQISFGGNTDEIIDLSNVDFSKYTDTNFQYMFSGCTNVKELHFNNLTTKPQSIRYMFQNCYNLETANFDTIDLGGILAASNLSNAFADCRALTDDSLDRILAMCISCPFTSNLFAMGFRNYLQPVSRIEALPHYQDFIDAGWTIGY
jgi:hypothetical protein